jgi:hypothetical protein
LFSASMNWFWALTLLCWAPACVAASAAAIDVPASMAAASPAPAPIELFIRPRLLLYSAALARARWMYGLSLASRVCSCLLTIAASVGVYVTGAFGFPAAVVRAPMAAFRSAAVMPAGWTGGAAGWITGGVTGGVTGVIGWVAGGGVRPPPAPLLSTFGKSVVLTAGLPQFAYWLFR